MYAKLSRIFRALEELGVVRVSKASWVYGAGTPGEPTKAAHQVLQSAFGRDFAAIQRTVSIQMSRIFSSLVGISRQFALQLCVLLLCWSVTCWTHWSSDGLWFQTDAPAHAITGLFYRDFLTQCRENPLEFTRRYYARYPTICPNAYPPVFYLLEAAAFLLYGPSTEAAKGVVLLCLLGTGLYALAWLRRWIEPDAGAAAGLLLLTPGVVTWSHAIMTNIPALMFGIGSLYHVLRAFESIDERSARHHLWLACLLASLGILTHPLIGVVVLVGAVWMLALRRWQILFRSYTWFAAFWVVLFLLPAAVMLYRWGPGQFAQLTRDPTAPSLNPASFNYIGNMSYYARHFVVPLVGIPVLVGASAGLMIGLMRPRFRKATTLLLIWATVPYLFLSLLWAKDARYLLVCCPALTGLIAIAIIGITDGLCRVFTGRRRDLPLGNLSDTARSVQLPSEPASVAPTEASSTNRTRSWQTVFSMLVVIFAVTIFVFDHSEPIPSVRSLRECTAFLEQIAPCEPVLYHGRMQGVYTFHLCAHDPGYRRQMVSLRNLFGLGKQPQPDLTTTQEIILSAGPRWLAVETPIDKLAFTLPENLREFVKSDEVELVRSFSQPADQLHQLNVYRIVSRFREDADQGDCFDLPQRVLGKVVLPIRQ